MKYKRRSCFSIPETAMMDFGFGGGFAALPTGLWSCLHVMAGGKGGFINVCWERDAADMSQRTSQVVLKNPSVNAGDIRNTGSIPRSGTCPEGGHGNPLQNSCLENPMYRGAWWAVAHKIAESRTWLKWLSTHRHPRLEHHKVPKGRKKTHRKLTVHPPKGQQMRGWEASSRPRALFISSAETGWALEPWALLTLTRAGIGTKECLHVLCFTRINSFKKSLLTCYNIASVSCSEFLAPRHVGSYLPNQGLNPHSMHWKMKSQPPDYQGSPYID